MIIMILNSLVARFVNIPCRVYYTLYISTGAIFMPSANVNYRSREFFVNCFADEKASSL